MRTLTLMSLALVPALTACPESIDCTNEAVASVQLTVESSQDATFSNLEATFTGGNFVDEPCDLWGDTTGAYICGYEVAGTIEITVSADMHEPKTVSVEVAEDECHVITESETVELVFVPDE